MNAVWETPLVKRLIGLAIEEDLSFGDLTSELTIPEGRTARAEIVAKEAGVCCGLGAITAVLRAIGSSVSVTVLLQDGDPIRPGTRLAELDGAARELLLAERTILNFLQRLSGIATAARRFAEQASPLCLLDTRKTTPGWRVLEKYAVRVGGAKNHRFHLGDMILVKDNHIDMSGVPLRQLVSDIIDRKPAYVPVQVEVRSLAELKAIAGLPIQSVMLDNMDDSAIRACLDCIQSEWRNSPSIEVSGNVGPDRFEALRALGVRFASTSALTRAASLDLSMNTIRSKTMDDPA